MAPIDEKEKVKKADPVEVDINNLELADEEVEVNTEADAFAGPPPPDDGDHLVKMELGKRKVVEKTTDKGQKYLVVSIVSKIITGPFENRLFFDDFLGSTFVQQGSGTCGVAGILKALGEQVTSRTTRNQLARELVNKLAGEPMATVTSQWEAYCSDCEKTVLRGQKRFPENGNGSHRHQIECQKCGSLITAQAKVKAYKAAPQG